MIWKQTIRIFCYFLFWSSIFFNILSCSDPYENVEILLSEDDKSLIESQLSELQRRSLDATTTTFITTKKEVTFVVEQERDIIVDWGDGTKEINQFSHTYTDENAVHTISFLCRQDALKKLSCVDQEIIRLDVSRDTLLTNLRCGNNRLTDLDITKNQKLESLSCENNHLSSLPVAHNSLKYLVCPGNELTSLNVASCLNLVELNCSQNKLTTLDVSQNIKIEILGCGYNALTSLILPNNGSLKSLECNYNELKSIDLSKNPLLKNCKCAHNRLISLDLTHNNSLAYLWCNHNQLESIAISPCSELRQIWCYGNSFETDLVKLLELAMALPSREGKEKGWFVIFSNALNMNTIKPTCEGLNWWVLGVPETAQ